MASRINPQIEAEILCLNRQGIKASAIASLCGVATRTVERVRRRNQEPAPIAHRHPGWSEHLLHLAEELLEDGAGYRETAETTGIPRTTLQARFPGMGMSQEEATLVRMTLRKVPDDIRTNIERPIGKR